MPQMRMLSSVVTGHRDPPGEQSGEREGSWVRHGTVGDWTCFPGRTEALVGLGKVKGRLFDTQVHGP